MRFLLQKNGTAESETEEEGSWATPMLQQEHEVSCLISNMDKKSDALADKMLDIVNTERELAEKEKVERRRIARERRQAKKGAVIEDDGSKKDMTSAKPPQKLEEALKITDGALRDALSELEDMTSAKSPQKLEEAPKIIDGAARDALSELEDILVLEKKPKRRR
jgi:hypothetical protein